MNSIVLNGRGIVCGIVEGPALVSHDPLVWSHGINPATGKINDVRVKLHGVSIKDTVLVYPYGKGASTTSTWILETIRQGNGPKAILNKETEMIISIGSMLGEILYAKNTPVLDRFDQDILTLISTGDWIKVDGYSGTIEIIKTKNSMGNI